MRIIGGRARGRTLKSLGGLNTRPTSDKVKEAIFNVLSVKLQAAQVLDLFAGSGALGLEALSRGADFAVLVEKSRQACEIIQANAALTGLTSQVKLYNRDALQVLKSLSGEKFDLVFVDPPYRQGLALISLAMLGEGNYLGPNGVIIVETSREEQIPVEIANLSLRKRARYGDTEVWYYQLTETGGREF
ncbi:MAG: 16S rRNA (guanine(966)-N(2))-methyltransferase RsmD [Peptococcaceae bacterium]|nr:16S rRNA (guanine(966)-N(2))-methyltransferase RsmD [Peptococcaceae bacterium]